KADGNGGGCSHGPCFGSERVNFLDVQRSERSKQHEQADGHRRVADACDDEGLARRVAIVFFFIPKADQQIAAEPDTFPSEIQEYKVVGQDENQHGADEQVQVGKETREAGVVRHVADGIDVNKESDKRDNKDEDDGERI